MLINKKSPHGGDIYTNAVTLDFSANVNPFGMPDEVKQAIINAAGSCRVYPDPYCGELRERLSARENIPAGEIICGNGAAELIYQFAYSLPKNKPALLIAPTFAEYACALNAAEIETEYYFLKPENSFSLTDGVLDVDFSRYSAVFVCTPNNPTGITVTPELLYKIADACAVRGTKLFCDLCFLDLSDAPEQYDIPRMISNYPNIFILKAFTKSYGMAGVRLGYGMCGCGDFLSAMTGKAQCWNVSTLAQKAGIAALDCGEWLSRCKTEIRAERSELKTELEKAGIIVYAGEANFLLFYSEIPFYKKLLERKILVRDCSNYIGLKDGYIRTAIKRRDENAALIENIREIIKNES